MNKDKKNNTKPDSVKKIHKLIKDKKAYGLLISNRTISFRKKMVERLDKVFRPIVGWKTWKIRFLYPEKTIPKKNAETISNAMADMLLWALQEQVDYLTQEKAEMERIIKESLQIIEEYTNGKLKG